jgi:hypothetical protein
MFGFSKIVHLELKSLAVKELQLREGQANDELHSVRMALPLPSMFGFSKIVHLELESLMVKELQLMEGQANDELHSVRMALSEKSFLFRKNLQLASSKLRKGRAWAKVHGVSQRVQAHWKSYNAARAAMVALGCLATMETKYQVLQCNQLKISTAAVKSGTGNAEHGSQWQDDPLAWFWTMNIESEIHSSNMLSECKSYPVLTCIHA